MTGESASSLRSLASSSWQQLVAYCHRYRRLHIIAKCFVWFLVLFHIALFALLIAFRPARVFQFIYDTAKQLRTLPFGWLILFGIMGIISSFPPLVGYSTSVTLCGFAYGLQGFYIAGSATFIGSGLAFIVLRLLFRRQIAAWASKNEKWQALEAVIEARGLPLIILIRLSSFPPYVYSQAFFASISVVKFWQFMLATVICLPRVFIEVFIGSRVAKFSDGEQRDRMDTTAKIVNGLSIAFGIILTVGLGWFLYRTTQEKILSLRNTQPGVNTLAEETLEGAEENEPLLQGAVDSPNSPILEDNHLERLSSLCSHTPIAR